MKKQVLGRSITVVIVLLIAFLCAWPPESKLSRGIELAGGVELLYRVNMEGIDHSDQKRTLDETIDILTKRLNIRGVMDIRIQKQGSNGILIQVPGTTLEGASWVRELMSRSGKLQFMIVCKDQDKLKDWKKGRLGAGLVEVPIAEPEMNNGQPYLLYDPGHSSVNDPVVTGEYIRRVNMGMDRNGLPSVNITFDPIGESRFGNLTLKHKGDQLAIVLDGKVYSAPVIEAVIFGTAVITSPGGFKVEEAQDLIATLKAGSLPAELEFDMETGVGPTLGSDSIKQGLRATTYGFIAVVVIMLLIYMVAGFIANAALCMNLLLIFGALALFQADLTLPGIAGIVLTLGMAVDANVLIFERIREELDDGKELVSAVDLGYKRAFVTIMDANITTLITAGILYGFGTGPVKGFATTLMIGILVSMFTALFVTRIAFDFLISRNIMKRFHMLRYYKRGNVKFLNFGKATLSLSCLLICVGIGMIIYRGEDNLDIDFSGGTLLHINLKQSMPIEDVRKRLNDGNVAGASVQNIWTAGESKEVGAEYTIRIADQHAEALPEDGIDLGTGKKNLLTAKESIQNIFSDALLPIPFESLEQSEQNGARFLMRVVDKTVTADAVDQQMKSFMTGEKAPEALTKTANGKDLVEWAVTVKPEDGVHAFEISAPLSATNILLLKDYLSKQFHVSEPFARISTIGSEVAASMVVRAIASLLLAMIVILFYIRLRFEKFSYGLAAIAALSHDVLVTMGLLAILGVELNLTILAALLTIVGYSLNDTIVVFDRIRENKRLVRKSSHWEVINLSINQTLGRTINTSITTFIVITSLFIFGGGVIHGFATAMGIGVIAGTYSSIFIASPIVAFLEDKAAQTVKS